MKKEVEKMEVMMNNEWLKCCRWWLADTTGLQFAMNVSYCRGKPVTTNISILGILLTKEIKMTEEYRREGKVK